MKRAFLVVLVVSFVVFSSTYTSAQEPWEHFGEGLTSPQSSAGGATAQAIEPAASNPDSFDPDVFAETSPAAAPPPTAPMMGIGAGLRILWSRHMTAYVVPASYMITPDLKVEAVIPYIDKELKGEYTGEELKANGFGDVSLGLKYRYGSEARLQGVTTASVKFPTGEYKQFSGRQEQLALGSGSYDFCVHQTLSRIIGRYRLLASVGYRLNTDYDYTETDNFGRNVKFEGSVGDIFNYLVGADYFTPYPWLTVYLNASGMIQQRSHIKETDTADGSVIRDQDKQDRLEILDINMGCKLQITDKVGVRLGVSIPALTEFDPDVLNHESRDWVADLGVFGRF